VNYDPNLKGVLFRNDKGENANRPDYRGTCVINNVDYNVSGWIKASKKTGDKYMSLSFQAKGEGKVTRSNQPAKTEMTEDNWHDDAIPF
jgi:uncharacterized protein (DUF736 family)